MLRSRWLAGLFSTSSCVISRRAQIAEEIDAAIRPVVYGAARDDAAARQRLAELRGDAERVRAEIGDLAVAVTEARAALGSAEQAQREGNDAAILDHARELADQFIEQSQLIDDALATIVAAHAERRRWHPRS